MGVLQVRELILMVVTSRMSDQNKTNQKTRVKSVEINLAIKGEEAQPILISANLSVELRQTLLTLFQEFKVYSHGYMPRITGGDAKKVSAL